MKPITWAAILAAAILLLLAAQYLLLPTWYAERGMKLSGWLMMLSVAIGIVLSIWFVSAAIGRLTREASRGGRIGAYLGGYGIYPFALFLGFLAGGQIGGGFGDQIFGEGGSIVGVGVGTFVVTVLTSFSGMLLGYLVGRIIHHLVD